MKKSTKGMIQGEQLTQNRLSIEKLLSEIAISFVNADIENLDNIIRSTLEQIGNYSGATRCSLFSISLNTDTLTNTHEWCENPEDTQIANIQNIPFKTFGWHREQLLNQKIVSISRIEDYPKEATGELEWIKQNGFRSMLFIPLVKECVLEGTLGFYSEIGKEISWMPDFSHMLVTVGSVILNTLERKKAEEIIIRMTEEAKVHNQELEKINAELLAARNASLNMLEDLTKEIDDRKLAEERYKFQSTLLDAVGQSVIATGTDEKITYMNRAAEKLYGWRAVEALGRKVMELNVPEITHEQGIEIMNQLLVGKEWFGEFVVKRRDGKVFPVYVHDTPLLDEEDGLIGIIGVSYDITERKEAEKILLESEDRFKQLFKNMMNGVAVYMPVDNGNDFIFKDVNKAGELLSRIKRDEVVGKRLTDVFPGAREYGLIDAMQRVLKTGQSEFIPLKTYKDSRIQQAVENMVYKLPSGEIVAIYADTSDMEKTMEDLKISRETFRELVENLNDVIYSVNMEGRITYVSPASCQILGYNPEELIGRHFSSIVFPGDKDEIKKAFEQILRGEIRPREYRMVAKSGEGRWVRTSSRVIKDGEKVTGIQGILTDIDERKQAEENLKIKMDELERFNDLTVDREFKMIELKREVNQLLQKQGNSPKYKIVE